MNRKDWQDAAGRMPEDMHLQLLNTLNRLEEHKMKKRVRFPILLAAAVAVMLLAGAAVAASQAGLLDFFAHSADPIVPLDGAEEMVVKGLGTSENELVTMCVEEAAFDGQGVLAQVRLTPKDTEHYALLNTFMQDTPEDVYIIDKDAPYLHVTGRKDGRQIISYMIHVECADERLELDTLDMVEIEDGSIVWWASGSSQEQLDVDAVELTVSARITVDDEPHPVDSLTFTVPKAQEMQRAILTSVAEPSDAFSIVSAEINYSRLRAYLTVCYQYDASLAEDIAIHIFDAKGNQLPEDSGEWWEQDGLWYEKVEVQSFNELPERLWLGAKVIGEDRYIGRVECEVIPD